MKFIRLYVNLSPDEDTCFDMAGEELDVKTHGNESFIVGEVAGSNWPTSINLRHVWMVEVRDQ